jgi:hypothetical protein
MRSIKQKLALFLISSGLFMGVSTPAHAMNSLDHLIDSQPYVYAVGGFIDQDRFAITARFNSNLDLPPDEDMKANYEGKSLEEVFTQWVYDFSKSKRGQGIDLHYSSETQIGLDLDTLNRFQQITSEAFALFTIIKDTDHQIKVNLMVGLSDLVSIGVGEGTTLEEALRNVMKQIDLRSQ